MKRFLLSMAVLASIGFAPGVAYAADTLMEKFFVGRTTAVGSFSAINGVNRTFDVKLTGRLRGDTLILREDFVYDDGEKDRKTWRFVRTAPNTYRGTREDVVGTTTLRVSGNTARFSYLVDLDPGPKKNVVRFFDRMVLSDDGKSIVNTATVWKYVLPVARVRVDFQR